MGYFVGKDVGRAVGSSVGLVERFLLFVVVIDCIFFVVCFDVCCLFVIDRVL